VSNLGSANCTELDTGLDTGLGTQKAVRESLRTFVGDSSTPLEYPEAKQVDSRKSLMRP
jgi:hypothetical protein